MSTRSHTEWKELIPKIINGGIAGIVGVSVIFPMDLVKTRLQTQPVGPNGEVEYKNMIDCFKKTYAAEGYFGMYRGSAVNIILVTPEKAVKLSSNDLFRYWLMEKDGSLPLPHQMLAGGMAGACQAIITTPMELLKIRMQDAGRVIAAAKKEGKVIKRPTAMGLIRELVAKDGVLGFYKGVTATGFRDVIFSVVYFPLFAGLNHLGPRKPGDTGPPFWWSFLSGCISGAISALSVTPFDVVKTRMQVASELRHKSVLGCIAHTLKVEGPTGFFKGGACRVMVLAPLYGIAQSVYFLGVGEWLLGYEVVNT